MWTKFEQGRDDSVSRVKRQIGMRIKDKKYPQAVFAADKALADGVLTRDQYNTQIVRIAEAKIKDTLWPSSIADTKKPNEGK